MPEDLTLKFWKTSFAPGQSVVKLDGTLGKRFVRSASLTPSIPFTRLPASLFDSGWKVLSAGRWLLKDHMALGEGRAHTRILQALAALPHAHDHRIICLEDNAPVSFSMTKGRSSAPAFNFLIRKRAAATLAANILVACPWTQTSLMPADEASRKRHGGEVCPEVSGSGHPWDSN